MFGSLTNKRKLRLFLIIFAVFVMVVIFFSWKFLYSPSKQSVNDFDVDLVYLWVDGSDPKWQEQRNYWLQRTDKQISPQDIFPNLYQQVDELKYSLRSVEKYLPWIHHIYIVTSQQIPEWLNLNNSKITIVDDSELIPQEYLPIFNSNAIESVIWKIPGLSEHFLYSNDDMFVNRPLDKDFFFFDGRPITRLSFRSSSSKNTYNKQLSYAMNLIKRDFGNTSFLSRKRYQPHHNIDAYLKSDYQACAEHFEKEYAEMLTHRFRQENSIQRFIVSIWSHVHGHSEVKLVSPYPQDEDGTSLTIDSLLLFNRQKNLLERITFYNPALFCINDTEKSSSQDRIDTQHFLEEYFPKKSKFEK